MGFFSSIGSAISGCFSAACSFVGKACSVIGGAIAGGIGALATGILPILGPVLTIVGFVANLLGMKKEERELEDYGEAMTQCEKKPENFDSMNEYITYLGEEIEAGRIKLKENKTEEEKMAYQAMGCALMIKGIEEKYNLQTDAEFWQTLGKKQENDKITKEECMALFENAGKNDIDMRDIGNYIAHREIQGNTSKSAISNIITTSIKEADPSKSDDERIERFNRLLSKDER